MEDAGEKLGDGADRHFSEKTTKMLRSVFIVLDCPLQREEAYIWGSLLLQASQIQPGRLCFKSCHCRARGPSKDIHPHGESSP